jgi:DNA-binding transcriptional LysR family regulator
MDRTDAIAVFIAVADHGSFAAAARRLGRSPASVTRAVADLESRLGVRLLTRTTRAVSTTEAGQRFLGGAKRVLADLDEIERAAAGQGTAPRGELRLTAPILFGRLHVLPIVTEFLDRFPEVQAALALVDRPVDLVEEGLDVAVRIGALGESSAVATRVGALRRIVVASPDYLARRGTPQRPADLSDHDVVAFSGIAGVEHWVFREAARDVNVAIRPRLVVSTAEAAIDTARAASGSPACSATKPPRTSPAVHCCACCPPTKVTRCRSTWSIPADGIHRRSYARSSTSPRRACAAAAPRSREPFILTLSARRRQHHRERADSIGRMAPAVARTRIGASPPRAGFFHGSAAWVRPRGAPIIDPPRPACASPQTLTCLPRHRAPSCS